MLIPDHAEKRTVTSHTASYQTTRRGLIAAASVFAAMLSARTAHAAFSHKDHRDHGTHRSGQCLLRGTHVLTPRGEVKVEDLGVGDLVTTFDGTSKPIKWIGRRSVDATSVEAWPGQVLPIKIARGALGPGVPHADLFVSSMHAIYIDGLLIPARSLVNGRSIVHCRSIDCETIEYFHIELDRHDVIFTEGAPTETLLAGSERQFDNWQGSIDRSGDGEKLVPFAPLVAANGRAILRSRLRSAVSPLIDLRRPGDATWERLAERADTQLAA
jgi:hypothetical protein